MRFKTAAVTVASIVAALTLALGHSASATTWLYNEHGQSDGYCINDPQDNKTNGTQLNLWQCRLVENDETAWEVSSYNGGVGYFQIRFRNSNSCLDLADGGSDGGKIQIWTCNGDADQAWFQESGNNGQFWMINSDNYFAVDLTNNTVANGTLIQAWTKLGDNAQDWELDGI